MSVAGGSTFVLSRLYLFVVQFYMLTALHSSDVSSFTLLEAYILLHVLMVQFFYALHLSSTH